MSFLRVIHERLFFTISAFQNMAISDRELMSFRSSISYLFDENCYVTEEDGLRSWQVCQRTETPGFSEESGFI